MTKFKGIIYASLGAAFFGISSIIAGLLFNRCSIEPGWLVTTRMLFSGLLLLAWLAITKHNIFSVWSSVKSSLRIVAFGIFGVTFCTIFFSIICLLRKCSYCDYFTIPRSLHHYYYFSYQK
ncbi:EamA family transporter [Lactococcus lactis]|uniref:EamA family transporter n=1 Tax=Lactococcus lactis TaxID=1358 RepID=UPI002FC84A84